MATLCCKMSREKDLNKILGCLLNDNLTDKEISEKTGLHLNRVLGECSFLKAQGYVEVVNLVVYITESGKEFYKKGGYVWKRIKEKIIAVSGIVGFIIIIWTFVIELRGCKREELKGQELKQSSPTV